MAKFGAITFKQAQHVGGPFQSGRPIGLVLHRTEASYSHCLASWLRGNPKGTSVHFLVGKKEPQVVQLVDTGIIANHAGPANEFYLGIEFESIPANPGIRGQDPAVIADELTPFQVVAGREIVDWISKTHAIPKEGPPTLSQWTACRGRWNGVLGHADLSRGSFFVTKQHGDYIPFGDMICLGVWPK